MAFDEIRISEDVERGAVGGPEFKTTVAALSSGFEKRNVDWAEARNSWDIGYGITSRTQLAEVIDFFWARQGRARGFRFKDWSDFEVTQDTSGNIGTGDGIVTAFQARKQYISGLVTYNRELNKLVTGTVQMFLDDVLQGSGFTIDHDTGIITFSPAVPDTVVVSITAEFDIPVRFDTDKLDITMELFSAGQIPNLPVIELRIQ